MSGLNGLDKCLEPPDQYIVEIDATCGECGEDQLDVDAVEDGDELHWECPECGEDNTEYRDLGRAGA